MVFLSPGFDERLCFVEISEPMGIQALRPEGPVEGLDEGVVGGLPARERSIFTPF
jgi:hypothetical protein